MPDLNAPSSGLSTGLAHPDGNRLKKATSQASIFYLPMHEMHRIFRTVGYFGGLLRPIVPLPREPPDNGAEQAHPMNPMHRWTTIGDNVPISGRRGLV